MARLNRASRSGYVTLASVLATAGINTNGASHYSRYFRSVTKEQTGVKSFRYIVRKEEAVSFIQERKPVKRVVTKKNTGYFGRLFNAILGR